MSELQSILFVGQNRLEMGIFGAGVRLAVGTQEHRILEKIGDLSELLLFVFCELHNI